MKKIISKIQEILNSASSLPVKETAKKAKQKILRPTRTKKTKSGKIKKIIERESLGETFEEESLDGRLDEL